MPKKTFRAAIDGADHLQWREGLQAVKRGEGAGQITAREPGKLLGSACIDDDCLASHPNDSRWDYVIGYERSKAAVAHFVEVHSAETSEVSKIEEKLAWLLGYLEEDPQAELKSLRREIHWVASDRVNIPKHTPQFKRLNTSLRKSGLKGPVKSLELT